MLMRANVPECKVRILRTPAVDRSNCVGACGDEVAESIVLLGRWQATPCATFPS